MHARRLAAAPLLTVVFALAGCPVDQGFVQPDDGTGAPGDQPAENPYWCCDPDQPRCVCEGYWHCTEGVAGKVCQQENPQLPDGGGTGPWSCQYRGELIVCTGGDAEHPDAGRDGEWTCTRGGGTVECSRAQDAGDLPDGEGAGPWDCAYSAEGDLRSCDESSSGGDGGTWDCTTAADGTETCVNSSPDRPDGGEWTCLQSGSRDICEGDHFPDGSGGSGWDCYQQGELVRCQNGSPQQPDAGGGSPWDCGWNDGQSITCVRGGDGGLGDGTPNGDAGGTPNDGGNPNDGNPPDGGNPNGGNPGGQDGGGGGCTCPAGAWRYCDTPTYCSWGTQNCQDNGGQAQWGPCIEDAAPNVCFNGGMYDEAAEQCAIDAGYCAQDFWDLDWDGDNQETLGAGCGDLQCVAPADGGGGGWGGGWF